MENVAPVSDNKEVDTKEVTTPRNAPVDIRTSREQLDMVVKTISDVLSGRKIDQYNLLRVVLAIMRMLDGFKTLNGSAKKNLLMDGLQNYITEDKNLTQEEKLALVALLDTVVSQAVDLFCEVAAEVKKSKCFGCFK